MYGLLSRLDLEKDNHVRSNKDAISRRGEDHVGLTPTLVP